MRWIMARGEIEDRPRSQESVYRVPITAPRTLPSLVGADLEVPLATGGSRRYANLDLAASAPAMVAVIEAVEDALPWYASVHRGAGFASQVSTGLYEAARRAVGALVGARASDSVIFVRNTTEAINLLAHALPLTPGSAVLTTAVEHHANLLPWRRRAPVIHLAPPTSPEALIHDIGRHLADRRRPVGIVAVTGAGNVTGEVFPVAEIARLAHEHGALIAVDAAQLAPHRAIDMVGQDIDCLSLSGHKLYAPFGAGVLVAPSAALEAAEPFLAGGGAVDFVTLDDVQWTHLPDRFEAGTPNVLGAVALGAAAGALRATGMEAVAAHERGLLALAEAELADIPGVRRYRLWSGRGIDHVAICTFSVDGWHHGLVAAALSAEHAIGVQHGCFSAHPYISHLLGISYEETERIRARLRAGQRGAIPGLVRASFGVGTTSDDIQRLAGALRELVREGPRLAYAQDPATGDFSPAAGAGAERAAPRGR